MSALNDQKTSFGYREVDEKDKAGLVRGVFDSVASDYDIMNDLMSVGIHRIWKSVLLDRLNPQPGQRLIDVAGGTGDIARGFLKRASNHGKPDKPANAIICDINAEMLLAGKAAQKPDGYVPIRVCGDAEVLPFPDRTFDAYTIGFGIRNVTHIDTALSEAYRVLRPGGRFVCLEFSHPITNALQKIYDAYSFKRYSLAWRACRQ